MQVEKIYGDLLDQPVEVIVNAWNRNIIPWWLLWPQGISGVIKKRGGLQPFKELSKLGATSLGGAVLTGAGRLAYKRIIHVAGIDMLWRSSEKSIKGSVVAAMEIVNVQKFKSVAFPVIGSGSGSLWGVGAEASLGLMGRLLRLWIQMQKWLLWFLSLQDNSNKNRVITL